jgi:hypothetical protein
MGHGGYNMGLKLNCSPVLNFVKWKGYKVVTKGEYEILYLLHLTKNLSNVLVAEVSLKFIKACS